MHNQLYPLLSGGISPKALGNIAAWYDVLTPSSLSGDSAQVFDAASSQYLTATGTLGAIATDYSVSFWVNLTTKLADQALVYSGDSLLDGLFNFYVQYIHATTKFQVVANMYLAASVTLNASATSAYAANHHVVMRYTASSGLIELIVDDGTVASTSLTPGVQNAPVTELFRIGRLSSGATYVNGTIDEVCTWTKKLSAAEVTALYNGGTGLRVSQMGGASPGTLLTSLQHSYRLQENNGTRNDSTGVLHLTASGGPTSTTGIVSPSTLDNGDPINTVRDLSGNARHLTQATAAFRPLYNASGSSTGKPTLLYDPTATQFWTMANPPTFNAGFHMFAVIQLTGTLATGCAITGGAIDCLACQYEGVTPKAKMVDINVAECWNATTAATLSAMTIQEFTHTAGSTADSFTYQDGVVDAGSAPVGAQDIAVATDTIGRDKANARYYFDGRMGEVILYSAIIPQSTARALRNGYFRKRWGLSGTA